MKDLCRYISNFDSDAHAKYKNQVVYSTMLVFFKNAFQYVSNIQPSLFQGQCPAVRPPSAELLPAPRPVCAQPGLPRPACTVTCNVVYKTQ